MKTGDKVVLKKCSRLHYQMGLAQFGTIVGEARVPDWIRVKWEGHGLEDNYPIADLIVIEDFKKETKQEVKMVKVVKNQNVKINGVERVLTISVVLVGNKLKGGYAVMLPTDKPNAELAEKIAFGRAMNPKTNLLDMEVGKGMDRKFIFHAVAEDLVRQIERGVVTIKGVK